MARALCVYLHHDLVGQLVQDDDGQLGFTYDARWLGMPLAYPLSQSLPLQKEPFKAKQCRAFFSGILPEQDQRQRIARNLGISERNDFAMLEQIGGECAGGVTFLHRDQPLEANRNQYRELTDPELAEILRSLPRRPLLAGDEGVRLSLAGAQDKMAVRIANGKASIPLGNAPSTHILKPAIEHFEGVVFNEALCLHLADAIGMPAASASIQCVEEIDYLLVKRYDRQTTIDQTDSDPSRHANPSLPTRLHQEDFCQALGVVSERKYQNEGGPSLKQCFELIRKTSQIPALDLKHFLDAVIFNFLIGNHDAHGKNFSLLYRQRTPDQATTARLAPLYDLVCTVYYPQLTDKMAMKLGSTYRSTEVRPRDFELLAEEAQLAKPRLAQRILELAGAIPIALNKLNINHTTAHEVAQTIKTRCIQISRRFGT